MKNVKVDEFINKKPESLIITCKKIEKNGKKGYNYVCKQQYNEDCTSINLTKEERDKLIDLSKNDSKQFIDSLIQLHLKNEFITSIYSGNNSLLPSKNQQFYNNCVRISTDNYKIYFNDLAIKKFEDTILRLNERSKVDSLNFIRGKLEKGKVDNMCLSIDEGFDFKKGRSVMFVGDTEYRVGPINTIYYFASVSNKGKVDIDDINNIITLIEEFTKYKGLARYANYISNEMVVYYNNGSLKITGMNKNSDMKEKVHKKVNQLLRK